MELQEKNQSEVRNHLMMSSPKFPMVKTLQTLTPKKMDVKSTTLIQLLQLLLTCLPLQQDLSFAFPNIITSLEEMRSFPWEFLQEKLLKRKLRTFLIKCLMPLIEELSIIQSILDSIFHMKSMTKFSALNSNLEPWKMLVVLLMQRVILEKVEILVRVTIWALLMWLYMNYATNGLAIYVQWLGGMIFGWMNHLLPMCLSCVCSKTKICLLNILISGIK